jgi:hypothetical protein
MLAVWGSNGAGPIQGPGRGIGETCNVGGPGEQWGRTYTGAGPWAGRFHQSGGGSLLLAGSRRVLASAVDNWLGNLLALAPVRAYT